MNNTLNAINSRVDIVKKRSVNLKIMIKTIKMKNREEKEKSAAQL
jgi:hypothetical protein